LGGAKPTKASPWRRDCLEINQYGFFGADTDISAIHGPIPNISKIFD